MIGTVSYWEGDLDEVIRLANERLAIAERIGRADLQSGVLLELNDVYNARLETERAHEPLALAIELAGTGGSPTTRGWILRASGRQAALEGRFVDAEAALEEARAIFSESGATLTLARTLNWLGVVLWDTRDLHGAEETLREAIRLLKPIQDRGTIVESQRLLAQVLLDQGRLEEAERFALEARETVGAGDISSRSTTRLALGLVRAAQGRDDEAERLLREATRSCGRPGSGDIGSHRSRRSRVPPLARPRRRGGRGRGGARALRRPSGRARRGESLARDRLHTVAVLRLRRGRGPT